MLVSLNELQNAVYKAARGGGLPWGVAEEAGRAAVWLAERNFPADMSGALARREKLCPPAEEYLAEKILTPSAADKKLCPFICGAYLSDCGGAEWTLRRAAFPLVILPFAARAAARKKCISVSWEGAVLITDGENIIAKKRAGLSARVADINITRCAASGFPSPANPEDMRGVRISAAEWKKLQTFAARTFMPSDEKSRAEDAGGGD